MRKSLPYVSSQHRQAILEFKQYVWPAAKQNKLSIVKTAYKISTMFVVWIAWSFKTISLK